jgi:hypothetical protein
MLVIIFFESGLSGMEKLRSRGLLIFDLGLRPLRSTSGRGKVSTQWHGKVLCKLPEIRGGEAGVGHSRGTEEQEIIIGLLLLEVRCILSVLLRMYLYYLLLYCTTYYSTTEEGGMDSARLGLRPYLI